MRTKRHYKMVPRYVCLICVSDMIKYLYRSTIKVNVAAVDGRNMRVSATESYRAFDEGTRLSAASTMRLPHLLPLKQCTI